ncbi:tetratricopeptide repeat protein [Polyangium aurulentum]|uniref:tetratricopeptide repeat protein n=1 Tax=Polyangium aurulentum TaxID=2567896 RepID=UPI0010ADD89F|nr:tetratricopeptide repeat protein [Polyangium aurulentum]UQA55957.1 tetratricopeptide repeat protein [Polyangium aurulentum]
MIGRKTVLFAALLACSLGTESALAQPKKSSPEEKQARALFDEGITLSDDGKWAEALEAFQKSDALVHSASARFNIAATQRALGRYVEAKRTLEKIIADSDSNTQPLKPGLRKDVDRLLGEVQAKVVHVRLSKSPTDAEVQIDGTPTEPGPDGRVELDPGKHVFVISANGHQTATVTKVLEGDTDVALTAPKVAVAPPPPPPDPLYKRGWFWGVVGGAVAVGAAVAVTVVATRSDGPVVPGNSTSLVIPVGVRF